jgi:hypothetical protein
LGDPGSDAAEEEDNTPIAAEKSEDVAGLMDDLGERPRDVLSDDDVATASGRSPFGFIGRLRDESRKDREHRFDVNLSKEDIRRLQGTLFELLECKRVLDQAR